MEITNTENLKNDVKEDVEEVELDYSSIKRLLLIMSGVERNPGPGRTNLETLNWLNENSAKAEKEYKLSYEAEKFFGRHIGTSNTVIKWKRKFEQEKYDVKREISLMIMKERGKLGKFTKNLVFFGLIAAQSQQWEKWVCHRK